MRIPGVRLHSRTCLPELSVVADGCYETVPWIAALGFDAAVPLSSHRLCSLGASLKERCCLNCIDDFRSLGYSFESVVSLTSHQLFSVRA